MSFDTLDTFGVYILGEFKTWSPVAICDTPARARFNVDAYQELTRGRVRIMVDRLPRRGNPKATTACGYCARVHFGKCHTDTLGNPEPIQ